MLKSPAMRAQLGLLSRGHVAPLIAVAAIVPPPHNARASGRAAGYSKATPILLPLIQTVRQFRITRSPSVIN
jgi:hypothetical protein